MIELKTHRKVPEQICPQQLIQYLERDWSVKTEVPADPPEFGVWTFNSYDSAGKTSLQLGVRFENLNNGLTMTIYCPFWMLNKTGLNLSYRVSRTFRCLIIPSTCFRMLHLTFCAHQSVVIRLQFPVLRNFHEGKAKEKILILCLFLFFFSSLSS